jgi:hypothetical protein
MNADVIDIEELQRSSKDARTESSKFFNNFANDVKDGDLLDYLDTNKKWKQAKMISKDQSNIGTLRLLGWSSAVTYRVPVINTRVRPFRSDTQLDTSSYAGEFERNEVLLLTQLIEVHYFNEVMGVIGQSNFLLAASPNELTTVLRGRFVPLMIEMQKIDRVLSEPALQVANVRWPNAGSLLANRQYDHQTDS